MTSDNFNDIDLSTALTTLYKLESQEGDLGRAYWRQISELLKEASSFRQRALIAEDKLRRNMAQRERKKIAGKLVISKKEIVRIATAYTCDVARMQKVLLLGGKDYQIDEVIIAWIEYSDHKNSVWGALPDSDDELLSLLLRLIGSRASNDDS